jgi:hypothetical protein
VKSAGAAKTLMQWSPGAPRPFAARFRLALIGALLAVGGTGCSSRGEAGSGGNGAGWPNTPGGNCGDYDASVANPLPLASCDGGQPRNVCESWAASVEPPDWPFAGGCDTATGLCALGAAMSVQKQCTFGPAGDAFCSAWYQGWVKGDGAAVAYCFERCIEDETPGHCVTTFCVPGCSRDLSGACKLEARNAAGSVVETDCLSLCVQRGNSPPTCEVPCQ